MNIRVLLLLGCLFALSSQAQESKRALWTWTDANGVTHFSDRPVPGARKVEIATSIPPPPQVATPQPSDAATSGGRTEAAAFVYRSLEVWQPENDQSFFGADATVEVRIRSEPELATGHTRHLYLDGALIEAATNLEAYTLTSLSRGAHSLSAVVYDERGNELIRSRPRVFHVRQPTINAPAAVGPNLRPPVTPTPTVPGNRAPRGG
jgi:hypothetical protein